MVADGEVSGFGVMLSAVKMHRINELGEKNLKTRVI